MENGIYEFIFQAYNLMMFLCAKKNVRLSLELHDKYYDQDMDRLSTKMLPKVGLGERVDYYYPAKLSGGQRQRVVKLMTALFFDKLRLTQQLLHPQRVPLLNSKFYSSY